MRTLFFRIVACLALAAYLALNAHKFNLTHFSGPIASTVTSSAESVMFAIVVALILLTLLLDLYVLAYAKFKNSVQDESHKFPKKSKLSSEEFLETVFNGVGSEIAVIDRQGTILGVNEPWRRFSRENGCSDMALTGVGANYLSIFKNTLDYDMHLAHEGILAVLEARKDHFTMEYPCNSPDQQRWFLMSVSPYGKNAAQGLLITHTDITDLRSKSPYFLSSVFDDIGSHLAVISRDGTILAVNEPWRRFSQENGCTDMELTSEGANYLSVFKNSHDHEMHLAHEGILSVLDARTDHFTIEYPCDSPDQQRWFLMSVSPYGKNAVLGLLITHTDITNRKKTEMDLRLSEHNLLLAQKIGGVGSYVMDVTQDRWVGTEVLYEIYGIDSHYPRDLNGWLELIHPSDRSVAEMSFQDAIAQKSDFNLEFRIIRANDGAERHIHGIGKLECATSGKVIRINGTTQDITVRKMTEIALRWNEQHLHEAQSIGGVGSYSIDAHTGLWTSSLMLDIIFGIDVNHVRDFNGYINCVHPDDRKTVTSYWESVVGQGGDFNLTYRIVRKNDGAVRWIHGMGKCSLNLHGQTIRLAGTAQDITDKMQHKVELENAMAAAEAANLAKGRFLSNMSHELRTPMNGILGIAQLMGKPHVDAASRIEYADILLNTGQELLSLLNDILDLSKIEAGRFDLETNSFALATTFSKIIAMFEETAKAKGLRLQAHDTTPSAQRYIGDAHRLQQMLMNLVGNAIKFTQTGHVGIDVRELDRDNESACLEFSVTDTGIGIPNDNQAKLFQPFTQVDNSTTREFGGTGLGLSLVKEMARLMDGDVGVESQPGQGSRFWFKVRVLLDSGGQQLDATGHGLQTSGGHVATDAVTTPPLMVLPKRIMLVDDNLLNIWVINEMLRQHGHTHVTQFKNGSEAVDAVTRGDAFDLILIDLHMPILGGYEAVQQIRAWEVAHGGARVNIVALTADVNSAVHRQCLEGGIDALLTKPVLIQQLHETLTRWLN